jgi:hypothetical protein
MSSASAPLWTTLSIGTIVAAFLGWWGLKSVMIANNRQAWINALRDDLAQFFTSIDTIHFVMAKLSRSGESSDLEEQQKTRNAVLLAHRRILMRLNRRVAAIVDAKLLLCTSWANSKNDLSVGNVVSIVDFFLLSLGVLALRFPIFISDEHALEFRVFRRIGFGHV